jgi:hypothetical protein
LIIGDEADFYVRLQQMQSAGDKETKYLKKKKIKRRVEIEKKKTSHVTSKEILVAVHNEVAI